MLSVCKHCKKREQTIFNSDVTEGSINDLKTNHQVNTKENDWWAEKKFIMIAIIVFGLYYFYNSGSVINEKEKLKAKFTECECKEIWEGALFNKSTYTDILICMNLYVWYEESDGSVPFRENINPCYIEAMKYDFDSQAIMLGKCDCREGFIQEDRLDY